MKKLHVVCTVAILALAAMVLIGCDQPTSNPGDNPSNPGNNPSNPGDTWTKVETVDGLEGVWKSSASATIIQEGKTFQTTMETILTYPTVDGEVSIVQKIDGVLQLDETIPKDEIETILKNGQVPVEIISAFGYMEVNADKTKLKVTATVKEGDPNWEDVKMVLAVDTFEGDIKMTSEPTQITVEQYYTKQK